MTKESSSEQWNVTGQAQYNVYQNNQGPILPDNQGTVNITYGSPPPGELNPFGVPYLRNRYFSGREGVLLQLHEQLTQSRATAMIQAQAISGLGGIGKTQTAVEYAYRYHYEKSVYKTVFWVNADTEASLSSDFASLAEQVAIPDAPILQQDGKISAMLSWLNSHHHWLLIFDNADHPEWLPAWIPPNPRGKVLITSRASVFDPLGIDSPIVLDVLSEPEALTLLFERTGLSRTSEAEAEAKALNQVLDGLPLALEQAGAYIVHQKISFGRYLRAYRSQGLTQLEKGKAQTGCYPSSVLKTWNLNMAAVSEENLAATALLELSSFLAPDEIPECIMTAGAAHLGFGLGDYLRSTGGDAATDEAVSLALRELLALLSQYSLVRWSGDPSTYSVHRLVQAVVRDQITAEKVAAWLSQVTAAVDEAYPGQEFAQWPQCLQLLSHWLRIVEQAESISFRSGELGLVCSQAGLFLMDQGRYVEAEPLYLKSLAICKSTRGARHPSTATRLNNLAVLYSLQGRYDESEPLLQEVIAIRKSVLGDRHPSTAGSLNDLAGLYRSQRRYDESESLYLESLAIRKSVLGDRHLSTAGSLNDLAVLYLSQGRYGEAEPLYLESLDISKGVLGDRHPDIATRLNNLAGLYESQGRYDEAEPLYLESLDIRKGTLGERHPDTAQSLFNLAALYSEIQQPPTALLLIQQALTIYLPVLGAEHPTTKAANSWLKSIQQALDNAT
ncbi:MAG: tetratricopeptide repeat protein [Cyanobacteria bacterium J06555_13]